MIRIRYELPFNRQSRFPLNPVSSTAVQNTSAAPSQKAVKKNPCERLIHHTQTEARIR
jgi:hypothetical protein